MPIINVVGGTNFLGYYTSLVELQTAYPTGEPGDWAIIDGDPAAVYAWSEIPTPGWENSGTAGSITSVFGRPGPNIVAQADDYSADLIGDPNVYVTGALPYGTTIGITPAGNYVDDTLAALGSKAHQHPNLVNIDTINQDLRTNSAVAFKTLNLSDALPYETTQTLLTLTDTFQGGTAELQLITNPEFALSFPTGLGIKSSAQIALYTNGANLAAVIAESASTFKGDVYAGYIPANGTTHKLGINASTSGGSPVSAEFQLAPDQNELLLITSGPGIDPRFRINSKTLIGSDVAIGNYNLLVNNTSAEVARFNSSNAAGALIDISYNNTNTVLEAGSRLAIAGTGTKDQPMIQGYGTMYIDATSDLYIQNCVRVNDLYMVVDNANTAFGFRVNNTRTALNGLDIQEPAATSRIWSTLVSPVTADPSIGLNTYGGDQPANIIALTDQQPLNLDVYFGSVGLTQSGDVTQRLRTYTRGSGAAVWAFSEAASLYSEATETHTTSNHGMRWVFEAAPTGGGIPADAFTVEYGKSRTYGTSPVSMLVETDAAVDRGKWAFRANAAVFGLYTVNDAENGYTTVFDITRGPTVGTTGMLIGPELTLFNGFIMGAVNIDSLQTTITDTDAALPTSGAVIDYLTTTGYVTKTGAPVDNQVAVWTADGIIEGDANFTWDAETLTVVGAFQTRNGAQPVIDVQGAAAKESLTINNGAVAFNDGFADLNFAIRKNVSGSAFVYDAGLDSLTLDMATLTMNVASGGASPVVVTGANDQFDVTINGTPLIDGNSVSFVTNMAFTANTGTPILSGAGSITGGAIYTPGSIGAQGEINVDGAVEAGLGVRGDVLEVWSKDWGGLGTSGEVYARLSSVALDWYSHGAGPAFSTDISIDDDKIVQFDKLSGVAADSRVDVKGTLRLSKLNSGDEILTTDLNGDVQESGIKATTAPAGGSGFTVVEYAVAPVNPPAGFVWMQAKDANTKTWSYYDGVKTYSVDLSV